MRIFTWHVHGNYLYYLSRLDHDIYLPVRPDRANPYGGRGESFPFGANVKELPAEDVRSHDFDCVLFQSRANFEQDQYDILSEEQRRLPRIYPEHDPPREHPTDTRHPAAAADLTIVHVTHFNRLMWDNGAAPSRVIEHGVLIPPSVRYSGEIPRGLVAVNHLGRRGRRLGLDVFEELRREVPLDLVGMGSEELGGLGEIPPMQFPSFSAHYRFFFNPIRYTSLGLAVCEALTIGMPVLGLATTEMVTAVTNGYNGYLDTDPRALVPHMLRLLDDPDEARRLGGNARAAALERFGIDRFLGDWDATLREVAGAPATAAGTTGAAL